MRILLLSCGFISLGLAIAGIFLPILPTTPLLLLAAFLFSKSSDRWHTWLLNHPKFGPYIRNFQENKIIPKRVKITAISMLWCTIIISAILIDIWWLRLLLLGIALAVSLHISSYKSE